MSVMNYDEIRNSFAHSSYVYCREIIDLLKDGDNHGVCDTSDQAFAYESLEGSFEEPIECLMLELVTLIFMAGRCSDKTVKFHTDIILKILSENDLFEMLKDVTEDEKNEILNDLRLLGFIDMPE
ncbi:immunity protein Imm2 of predicted polymorphic toxin system [Serratia marcescens]|uniref:Immunity protein Imm2 of predicted polymorphic toxin system n=1 Tax=Serratia marcescens TaxID=615 RepID=A0AA46K201_SERMA|nr:Imm2 family immunity protein [Serratia marcescens]TQI83131.1 immunity protein Imm2 of predicted polymorphic toxin system [Serratia marcescens]